MADMSYPERVIYLAVIALILVPTFPIGLAWYRWYRSMKNGPSVSRRRAALSVLLSVSISYAFLLLGIASEEVIGPHYTTRRFATIYLNLALMVIAFLWSSFMAHPLKRVLVLGAGSTAVVWAFVLVVSSVV